MRAETRIISTFNAPRDSSGDVGIRESDASERGVQHCAGFESIHAREGDGGVALAEEGEADQGVGTHFVPKPD